MAAAAVAGDGGRGGVERKRSSGTTKYCGCRDVTTPQSFEVRETAAAVDGDGERGGVERRREAWWQHDYCGCSDVTTTKKQKFFSKKKPVVISTRRLLPRGRPASGRW